MQAEDNGYYLSIPREIVYLDRSNCASIPAGLSNLAAGVEH